MESYVPDQRYSSSAEPELGLGIVLEVAKGRVKIAFPAAGETRLYATESAPLRRITFKVGDTVIDQEGRAMAVERVFDNDGLCIYFGKTRVLSEADLGNMTIQQTSEERLLLGDVDTPRQFALRRRSLENDHHRRISSVNGFLGGRIDLIPHQLYIAEAVSTRHAPRVLLSDEVGLGKTIEACLIVHRLLMNGRMNRVLIMVPDSLVHQWFVELLRRFNLWFHIFDEPRCRGAEKGAPDANPFLDDQLILCGNSLLVNAPRRAQQAVAAGWDMLVVDEAHHLEWTPTQISPAYAVAEALSKVATGLLLLTATPEQLGAESHFARLRLLDPGRYADFATFQNEAISNQATARGVEKLAEGKPLEAVDRQALAAIVGEEVLKGIDLENATARQNLIQNLVDQHGPGRVIFRNRRSAMRKFPLRQPHLIPLDLSALDPDMQAKISAEIVAEFQPTASSTEPVYDYEGDLRLTWLLGLIAALRPQKVLLICNRKEKVLALEKAIKQVSKLHVGVFHEDLSLVLRDRQAAWFAEPDGARLLLCSEIGSEGRNFQFAHHLVLFDLPTNPELLEQRIGRLDRIGQTKDIQIHVPYLSGTPQEALAKWYDQGLNAFARNLEGGNRVTAIFGERLQGLAEYKGSPAQAQALDALIAETQAFHAQLLANLAAGRDRLLELNSFRPEVGERLIADIVEEDQDTTLEHYMRAVFEACNIDIEDLAPRTYLVHAQLGNAQAFPALPDEGAMVTFDRVRALSREDMSFLTWDHPMVTGAIDQILSNGVGTASCAVAIGKGIPALLLEVLFVLEVVGTGSVIADRFMPKTPIRVLIDPQGDDHANIYPPSDWDPQLRPLPMDDALDDASLMEVRIPAMLAAAAEIAELKAKAKIATGLSRMTTTLDLEIARLEALQLRNSHIRPAEIAIAKAERAQLRDLILGATLRLDALQLVFGRG